MRPRKCKQCRGARRVVQGGEIVPCPACRETGTRETPLQLFTPIMAGFEYAGRTGRSDA